jgi:hypothetical protein
MYSARYSTEYLVQYRTVFCLDGASLGLSHHDAVQPTDHTAKSCSALRPAWACIERRDGRMVAGRIPASQLIPMILAGRWTIPLDLLSTVCGVGCRRRAQVRSRRPPTRASARERIDDRGAVTVGLRA